MTTGSKAVLHSNDRWPTLTLLSLCMSMCIYMYMYRNYYKPMIYYPLQLLYMVSSYRSQVRIISQPPCSEQMYGVRPWAYIT